MKKRYFKSDDECLKNEELKTLVDEYELLVFGINYIEFYIIFF